MLITLFDLAISYLKRKNLFRLFGIMSYFVVWLALYRVIFMVTVTSVIIVIAADFALFDGILISCVILNIWVLWLFIRKNVTRYLVLYVGFVSIRLLLYLCHFCGTRDGGVAGVGNKFDVCLMILIVCYTGSWSWFKKWWFSCLHNMFWLVENEGKILFFKCGIVWCMASPLKNWSNLVFSSGTVREVINPLLGSSDINCSLSNVLTPEVKNNEPTGVFSVGEFFWVIWWLFFLGIFIILFS